MIDELLTTSTRAEGDVFGVVMLTGPKDRDTVVLPHVITNDTVTSAGRRWAWTLGQRYTWLERLRSGVRFISEL